MVSNGAKALETLEVAPADARAQIERLMESKIFETSDAHRRLLQYLSEKSLSGEADRLKEYTIGIEAFGKPDSYDPKHDSIVRLQVSRLRQKLAMYYQEGGASDPVVVSLPKGAFRLTFDRKPEHAVVVMPPRPSNRIWWAALAAVILWASVMTVLYTRAHRDAARVAETWTPELESLWSPFLQSNRSVLVCLGTPLFVRLPNFGFFRDPKTNDWAEVEKSERMAAARKAALNAEGMASYNFTGVGEASAAFLLGRLLATRKQEVALTRSSILSWQQIADSDVIFLGPPKFNLQLQTAALQQDIVMEAEGIRNLKPNAGEPVFLEDRMLPGRTSEGETHALITRTSGPSGAGELLMISGNASADTQAAAEWLTQPWHARQLAMKLRTPSGGIPRHFQVVLKVAFKQGVPVQSTYVFHHVLR
jgi:hypothetical protein